MTVRAADQVPKEMCQDPRLERAGGKRTVTDSGRGRRRSVNYEDGDDSPKEGTGSETGTE